MAVRPVRQRKPSGPQHGRPDAALTMDLKQNPASHRRAGLFCLAIGKGVSRMKLRMLKLEVRLWVLRLILIIK